MGLVTGAIDASKEIQQNGVVLDGYPRNLNQADQLQKLLETRGLELNAALCLDVSDDVLVDRICSTFSISSSIYSYLESIHPYHYTQISFLTLKIKINSLDRFARPSMTLS